MINLWQGQNGIRTEVDGNHLRSRPDITYYWLTGRKAQAQSDLITIYEGREGSDYLTAKLFSA